ncbi:hypothetical protein I79_019011 [Cricetulus griseus]|uniref:Uncharacterized protein n=1 Tax=Cricetulus griseus TaxID=10029 RepID=G3I699_CRIGR|nr:hypothetical protein I79_019011 [Cricetulus griseus]
MWWAHGSAESHVGHDQTSGMRGQPAGKRQETYAAGTCHCCLSSQGPRSSSQDNLQRPLLVLLVCRVAEVSFRFRQPGVQIPDLTS